MKFCTTLGTCLFVVAFWLLGLPVAAQEDHRVQEDHKAQKAHSQDPAEACLRYHLTRFRSSRGIEGHAPGLSLQISAPLNPRLRLEVAHLSGRGSGSGQSRISHFDLDLGLGWRLDDPDKEGDGPLQRIYALGQWSISEGRLTLPDGEVISERDEGAGVGFVRRPHPDRAVSYSWRAMVHPTFMNTNSNNIVGQRAILAQAAARFKLGQDGSAEVGYSYRTHKLTSDVDSSATEQGPFIGATFRF